MTRITEATRGRTREARPEGLAEARRSAGPVASSVRSADAAAVGSCGMACVIRRYVAGLPTNASIG